MLRISSKAIISLLLLVSLVQGQMATFFNLNSKSAGVISLDPSNPNGEYLGNTNSGTYTMGGTCANSVLIAYVWVNGAVNPAPVTYNGSAMTLVGHAPSFSTQPYDAYVFYLFNPPSGAHTLTASTSSGNTILLGSSYCGVKQSGFPDSATTTNGNTGTLSASYNLTTTTVAANAWIVGYVGTQHQITTSGIPSTVTVVRVQDTTFSLSTVLDSNNGLASPGVNVITFEDNSAQAYTAVVFSMAPA